MIAPRQPPLLALVDELLAEQGRLQTPVAQASAAHDRYVSGVSVASLSAQLIPLTAPGPGEQYAFEVDLDACSGCKSCVVACHALNGLDEHESWRDVGALVNESGPAFQQTVTTACHHCADPGCLHGCPVLAYEKDPVTGIVRHLDDQCIGCQYCILKCPYDVPKYNARLGIVRKCDLCHQRLAAGEAPACAQSCPTHAIRVVKVPVPTAGQPATANPAFLPAAPDPSYTQPTTRYRTRRTVPSSLRAADAGVLRPQPPHWPLVALLTLMPMAVGCGIADAALAPDGPTLALAGWSAGAAGLGLAGLHLGQPWRAWRVFLGLRRSWFSREAVLFGLWFPLATAAVAGRLGWLPGAVMAWHPVAAANAVGVAALLCSVMIYVDTHRDFWRLSRTLPRFFGTALVLGLATAQAVPGTPPALGSALALVTVLKFGLEAAALLPLRHPTPGPARQTARLLVGPLRHLALGRATAGLLGGILLPLLLAAGAAPRGTAWVALALAGLGELAERALFFRAVDAPKMPGQPDPTAPAHA